MRQLSPKLSGRFLYTTGSMHNSADYFPRPHSMILSPLICCNPTSYAIFSTWFTSQKYVTVHVAVVRANLATPLNKSSSKILKLSARLGAFGHRRHILYATCQTADGSAFIPPPSLFTPSSTESESTVD